MAINELWCGIFSLLLLPERIGSFIVGLIGGHLINIIIIIIPLKKKKWLDGMSQFRVPAVSYVKTKTLTLPLSSVYKCLIGSLCLVASKEGENAV